MSRPRAGKSPANPPRGANLGALLSQYMACPAQSKPPSFFSFVRAKNPHVFSHHDHAQSDYRDHVLKCSGLFIYRGCISKLYHRLIETLTKGKDTFFFD